MIEGQTNLGLVLQDLNRSDRLVVLAHLAELREPDGWFRTSDVVGLNIALRLPNPGNVSQFLINSRSREVVISKKVGATSLWSFTPHGRRSAEAILADAGVAIQPYVQRGLTADFLQTSYPTIPAELAPGNLLPHIRAFLEEFPFETNVFLMTRFPTRAAADPIASVIEAIRRTVSEHGLVLHVAFDRAIHDELWPNVAAHMWACKYGLGVLETVLGEGIGQSESLDADAIKALTLNDNVLLELGSMLTLGRRCKILKDKSAPQPPSDLLSQIYRTVDLADVGSVISAVNSWVTDDLLIR